MAALWCFPYHRLENFQKAPGVPMPASTQWDIAYPVFETAVHPYEELVRQAAQGELFHIDDTGVKILYSNLGQVIKYMQNHWQKLTGFLRIEGAPLDNNCLERALKVAIFSPILNSQVLLFLEKLEDKERIIARFLLYLGFILNTLSQGCFPDAGKPIPQKKIFKALCTLAERTR